jgi:hypothetical protein
MVSVSDYPCRRKAGARGARAGHGNACAAAISDPRQHEPQLHATAPQKGKQPPYLLAAGTVVPLKEPCAPQERQPQDLRVRSAPQFPVCHLGSRTAVHRAGTCCRARSCDLRAWASPLRTVCGCTPPDELGLGCELLLSRHVPHSTHARVPAILRTLVQQCRLYAQ